MLKRRQKAARPAKPPVPAAEPAPQAEEEWSWWPQRCCDQARPGPPCVCRYTTTCPVHGNRCHGSHD